MGPEEFADAWPRIVRALASFTGSLDDAEEYAAEAVARAADHARRPGEPVASWAAWCTSVAKRAWIDDRRRQQVQQRLAPELARGHQASSTGPVGSSSEETLMADLGADHVGIDELDDRLALLYVACDPALSPTSQLVLALRVVCGLTIPQIAHHLGLQDATAAARLTRAKRALAEARGAFQVPGRDEQDARLPVVLACVAGMFTVAHRTVLDPVDAFEDAGRHALSIADALVTTRPDDPEVRGLRAVIRLGLARRPGRLDADGTALPLDEVDRSRWDTTLLTSGLDDATLAARGGSGRFAIEAAISGLHSSAASFAETDWRRIVDLYAALEQVWPSPSVTVARLSATMYEVLTSPDASARGAELSHVETQLVELERGGAAYASRDAGLALADLAWRTRRRELAAARYRDLAEVMPVEPLRRFCLRRAAAAG